ncbi:MAG: hypothetical protein NZZ41_07830 [Candidatus Dojkabacteria bacterium]|nr:hypothetical protein [Candidatus Dojkabacteria bacterium]
MESKSVMKIKRDWYEREVEKARKTFSKSVPKKDKDFRELEEKFYNSLDNI